MTQNGHLPNGNGAANANVITENQPQGVEFVLQRIYIKDLSYEAPNSPTIFLENWQPAVELELQNQANPLGSDNFDVVMKVKVTAKLGDKIAYLVEVQQAGIFTIKHAESEQLKGIFGALCPAILFPYAREAISNVVTHGGFPQLLLAPINFDALYLEQLNKTQGEHNPVSETTN